MKTQKDSKKQYEKVLLIISCVFAAVSAILFILMAVGLPSLIDSRQSMQYLYENGIEVDAHIKGYYDDYGLVGSRGDPARIYKGRFHIVYEYIDVNGNTYTDEYLDTVVCRSRDELRAREQYIKQVVADGATMKMLIADNGLCCLSVYKESLISNKLVIIISSLLAISSGVLGLCIFGIVRQSKKLKKLKLYYN